MPLDAVLKLSLKRRFGARERWRMRRRSNETVLTSLGRRGSRQDLAEIEAIRKLGDV